MTDEKNQANATPSDNSGHQQEAVSAIDAANRAAERLERANAEQRALIERQEAIAAKQMLAGRSTINNVQQKTEIEVKREEHKNRWKNSGFDPFKGNGARALEEL